MNWSFRIAQVRGIDIKVHVTFFLILLLGAIQWAGMTPNAPAEGALFGVVLMILLFTCVTLHELGHSIAAQAFGIPVREIVLLPLGGVALISKNPDKPLHELIIAIAGPLVNVAIAVVLFFVTGATLRATLLDGRGTLGELIMQPSLETLLLWLLAANITLVVFNMIPAFPLDGGRVFRALLAFFLGFPRATQIASTVGQVLAIALGVLGFISGNFILVLIAVFVFFGAGQEQAHAQAKTVLQTRRVGDAYNKHALSLQIGDRVSRVVDYLLTSYQPDYAVMQGNTIIGIVTRDDVMRALAERAEDCYVTEIMQREFLRVEATRTLDEVRQLLTEQGSRLAAVFDGSRYLGLISLEDIAEAFAVLSFLERQRQLRQEREWIS
ncbi:MAG: site-2 protease family protein [Thermoflexales bacterium]|nr:site-2 protease family protein [Thermoflexales bacterium]MCS7324688.1 site-2 protease family protein [Thermoflexales bacterium]MDW8053343.1 site-2 protease family protein [Anaerolineae bacterium]MDW8291996.1 site-2 protease family protein [Anaerolineae bacterium]